MVIIASINTMLESLQHLTGFLFVVFVLTILWIVIACIGMIFKRIEKQSVSGNPPFTSASALQVSQGNTDEIPEEDLVLIVTTVAMLLGKKPHRLVSIRSTNFDWSREGRRQHVMSHTTH